MAKKARTRNFGDVLRAKLAANPELAEAVKEQSFNAEIAQQIYDLRKQANLTQKELAKLVDTQQSVISRIEDADYDGHSLMMLKRIAKALQRRLKVEFCADSLPSNATAIVSEFRLGWLTSQQVWGATIRGRQHAVGRKMTAKALEEILRCEQSTGSTSLIKV
jgi:transcriptional regulator with XRE-family HTH domain